MLPRPPRSPLFPYTTLFRSHVVDVEVTNENVGIDAAFGAKRVPQRPQTRAAIKDRSEEHTSELQSHSELLCRLLLEKKNGRSGRRRHGAGDGAEDQPVRVRR